MLVGFAGFWVWLTSCFCGLYDMVVLQRVVVLGSGVGCGGWVCWVLRATGRRRFGFFVLAG